MELKWVGHDPTIFSGSLEEIKTFLDNKFERDVGKVELGYGGTADSDYYQWIIVDPMMRMKLWQRADNYIGKTYHDYFVLIGHTRDSDALEESNFHTAIDMLGGESDTVKVIRSTHWLVGWVEAILIHKSDKDAIMKGENILGMLDEYPILDEDDYCRTKADMGEVDDE